MKVIIAGSRGFGRDHLLAALACCPWVAQITEVVSGSARGIDLDGEAWARRNGIPIRKFPADWNQGKVGGPIRNQRMAEYADGLIAVWDGKSRGTAHMIQVASRKGIRIYVWTPPS